MPMIQNVLFVYPNMVEDIYAS